MLSRVLRVPKASANSRPLVIVNENSSRRQIGPRYPGVPGIPSKQPLCCARLESLTIECEPFSPEQDVMIRRESTRVAEWHRSKKNPLCSIACRGTGVPPSSASRLPRDIGVAYSPLHPAQLRSVKSLSAIRNAELFLNGRWCPRALVTIKPVDAILLGVGCWSRRYIARQKSDLQLRRRSARPRCQ